VGSGLAALAAGATKKYLKVFSKKPLQGKNPLLYSALRFASSGDEGSFIGSDR
jgi:hypothetical protein